MGHGGVIALALAVHHPDAVSRVILHEPTLHARKHISVRMRSVIGAAQGVAKVGMHRRGAKRYLRYVFGGSAFDDLDAPVRDSLLAQPRTVLAEMEAGSGEELSLGELARVVRSVYRGSLRLSSPAASIGAPSSIPQRASFA